MKINLGDKFYSYTENDELQIIRLIRIKNENCFVVKDESDGSLYKLTENNLKEFTRLKPDGYINVVNVTMNDGNADVIVTLSRTSDLDNKISEPYAVCRQCIQNIFAHIVVTSDIMYMGCSVSQDTIPADMKFRLLLACDNITNKTTISVYMTDTLDDILSFVKSKKYDTVLEYYYEKNTNPKVVGFSKNLRMLLEDTNFMYDFNKAFNIETLEFKIELCDDSNIIENNTKLVDTNRVLIEDLLKIGITNTYVIPFSKKIDINKIQRNNIIVKDITGSMYIIAFDTCEYTRLEEFNSNNDVEIINLETN